LVLVLLVVVLLVILAGAIGYQVFASLAFGWIGFLTRVVPKISWNWDLLGMAGLCVAGLLGIGHLFIRWLAGEISGANGKRWSWPWRWTWCGALAIGVLFLVGMAVGGIVHQAGWIAASPEPLYEVKRGYGFYGELKQFNGALRMALSDSKDDWQQTRHELRKPNSEYFPSQQNQPAPDEQITCLLIVSETRCVGAIVFPRINSSSSASGYLLYWYLQGEERYLPITELGSLLRKHQRQLVAL